VIETLERAASEFALNHNLEQVQAAPEATAPAEIGMSDGTEKNPTHAGACISVTDRLTPTAQ
jgi:hypothetical protein